MDRKWTSVGVVVCLALVIGYFVGQSDFAMTANAQSSSTAGNVAVVMGPERDNRAVFAVVDNVERTIMLYEWDFQDRSMKFRAARNYTYDRLLENYGNARTDSPSPEQVQKRISQ